jgi:hypothetical protein
MSPSWSPSWFLPVDSYCERLGPGFWAEPINAVSNGAFILAAVHVFWIWRRTQPRDWPALGLIAVAAIVGIGSFLFHTFANRWSLLADVLPIAVFIYSYFLLAMRRYLRLGIVPAVAFTLAFAAFDFSFSRLWSNLFPDISLNGSVGYLPALMALIAVGIACRILHARQPGRALLGAGFIFALSLVFRSIDNAVCSALPLGTHALWHMLNALVLWILMIAALTRASDQKVSDVPR